MTTTGSFNYIDRASIPASGAAKPWSKVDISSTSYRLTPRTLPVRYLRALDDPSAFTTTTTTSTSTSTP